MIRETKRIHVPMVSRQGQNGILAPPIVVAVVGPPKVGKSTLIKYDMFSGIFVNGP